MRPGGSGRLFRREREMVRVRKICFLANDISLPGGLDRVNAALACALAENCEVWIGSLISGGKSWQREIFQARFGKRWNSVCTARGMPLLNPHG